MQTARLFYCLMLALIGHCGFATANNEWEYVSQIDTNTQLPALPTTDFPITQFGATSGFENDSLPSLKLAIEKAVEAGGGRVVVPPGDWYMKGPIHLKSHIQLHLEEGSHILFSPDPSDYLPVVLTRWEGTNVLTYSPMIYAANVEDVAITGNGTIDGNENSIFRKWQTQQQDDVQQLRHMGATAVPLQNRVFEEGTFLRPSLIQFFRAQRVLMDGNTVINAHHETIHLVYTEHAMLRNLKVESFFYNNNGINIDSSQWVIAAHNHLRTGDDAIVIKSGRDLDGRTVGIPSENIWIHHNNLGGEDGIGFGSEMSGGIQNVFMSDNTLANGHSAIRFKSNLDRGGVVNNIRARDFNVAAYQNLFWFQLNYPGDQGGHVPPTFKNIQFENFTVESANTFLEVQAPAMAPLQNASFKNIHIQKVNATLLLENAVGLEFENVLLGEQRIDGQLNWVAPTSTDTDTNVAPIKAP